MIDPGCLQPPHPIEEDFVVGTLVARTVSAVMTFVDSFIPQNAEQSAEQLRDMRVFLISHIFGPFLGSTVPLGLYLLDPTPDYTVVVLALSISAFWLFPPVLKWLGSYHTLALVSVQNLMFCILWSCFYYGGVASPTLPWVLVIPLLAFFYLGASSRLRWAVLAMFVANIVGFRLLYTLFPPPENDMPVAAIQGLGLTSTVAASLYVAMMAVYYARVLSHQAELETEMKVHVATASELRRATQESERASAAKAEFVARMSHELRTPLNAIIGYSDLLIEEAIDEGDTNATDILGRVRSSGHHLLSLVNKILDLSKIGAGKMELHLEPCSLDQLIAEIVKDHTTAAQAGGNAIKRAGADQLGRITTDIRKLRQMVDYLVGNGIKFTERGVITLDTRFTSVDGRDHLILKVIDTGIGIPEKDIPVLFERFGGLQDVTTSKYGGTGLGLALASQLAQLMGGTISVESALGIGSAFTIDLPVTRLADENLPGALPELSVAA
jgi:signal transduction histidine kinase